MKVKALVIALFFTGLYINIIAQTLEGAVAQREITWFGVDYSNVRLIGAFGFKSPYDIVENMFDFWNNEILKDSKFQIKRRFAKKNAYFNLEIVTERNHKVDYREIVIDQQDYHLSEEIIEETVQGYRNRNATGTGSMIIMESINKFIDVATMYVVVFDISTAKVLYIYKTVQKEGRDGWEFRQHWLTPIYLGLIEFEKNYDRMIKQYR